MIIKKEKLLQKALSSIREKRQISFIPTMGIGTLFSYLILFGIGLTKVFSGSMSLGDFIIMQSYVLLLQDPILELGFKISAKDGFKNIELPEAIAASNGITVS